MNEVMILQNAICQSVTLFSTQFTPVDSLWLCSSVITAKLLNGVQELI